MRTSIEMHSRLEDQLPTQQRVLTQVSRPCENAEMLFTYALE